MASSFFLIAVCSPSLSAFCAHHAFQGSTHTTRPGFAGIYLYVALQQTRPVQILRVKCDKLGYAHSEMRALYAICTALSPALVLRTSQSSELFFFSFSSSSSV